MPIVVQERDLHLLTITHPKNIGSDGEDDLGSESGNDRAPKHSAASAASFDETVGEDAGAPSSAAKSNVVKNGKIPVVFLMGRVRAGDSPVSFIMQV